MCAVKDRTSPNKPFSRDIRTSPILEVGTHIQEHRNPCPRSAEPFTYGQTFKQDEPPSVDSRALQRGQVSARFQAANTNPGKVSSFWSKGP